MDPAVATRALAASTEITSAAMESIAADRPDAVLDLVVRRAAELVEADLGLVMVRGDDDKLTVEAVHRRFAVPGAADPIGMVLSARSTAARVARGGVAVAVDDVTADPRTAPYVPPALRAYGPFVVAPFGSKEQRKGALAAYRRRGGEPFTSVQVELLTSFAAQAGLVLVLAEGSTARQRVAIYQERERIARELHDVIIQRLYATGVQLDLFNRRLADQIGHEDAQRLAAAVEELDRTIAEVRATVRTLRAADPDGGSLPTHTDLLDSVRAEVRTAAELLGFAPRLAVQGDPADVPVDLADHARAALREALSNVVRHSGARAVSVELRREERGLCLRVADDGCGIPPGVSKRGLRHLEERATAVGGGCDVRSSPQEGTTVTWHAPL